MRSEERGKREREGWREGEGERGKGRGTEERRERRQDPLARIHAFIGKSKKLMYVGEMDG